MSSSSKRLVLCDPEGDVLFWGYSVAGDARPRERDEREERDERDEDHPAREPAQSGIYLKAARKASGS
jgi:hypothetical protein